MALTTLHTNYLNGSYENDLRFLLKVAENNPLRLHPNQTSYLQITTDSRNRPVIGYGYDLVANRGQTAIGALTAAGVVLTPEQRAALSALTTTTTGIPTALAGLALPSEAAATVLLDGALAARNDDFTRFLTRYAGGVDFSRERAVLESMWYQGQGAYLAPTFQITQALRDGNRAEVWYQIRYGSAADGGGVINRRYAESAYFGLYEDAALTESEAKNIYRMFGSHRQDMLNYDQRNAAARAAATLTYGLAVPSLNDAQGLGLARDRVIADLTNTYTGLSAQLVNISATNLYLNPAKATDTNRGGTIDASAFEAYYSDKNDLLVGLDQVDVLRGGAGDDFLIGGAGNDALDGGSGSDTYVFATDEGKDTIKDSDGLGRIMVGGQALTGATYATHSLDGRQQIWESDDGKITYTFVSGGDAGKGTLTITGASLLGNGEIKINDFDLAKAGSDGVLGLKLAQKTAIELQSGGTTPFSEPGHESESNTAALDEGLSKTIKCFLNAPAQDGDIIKLSLAGGNLSRFACIDGANQTSFADGEVTLQLAEGQTEIVFAFLNTGDVDGDTALELTASTYRPMAAIPPATPSP